MEKEANQRPQMTGQARDEEEEDISMSKAPAVRKIYHNTPETKCMCNKAVRFYFFLTHYHLRSVLSEICMQHLTHMCYYGGC